VRAAAMKAINRGELDVFNNDMTTLTNDLLTYLGNHRNGLPGEATIGIAKRDMINGLIGTGTAVQRKANPLYSELNRNGSMRTFRLDRVNDIRPTGRTGLHFDYDKIKNNRMPRTDAATLIDDGQMSPRSGAATLVDARHADLEQRYLSGDKTALAKAQQMADAAAKDQGYRVGPVYHWTPDKEFNVFDLSKGREGHHFGTKQAATDRSMYRDGRTIRAFLKGDRQPVKDMMTNDAVQLFRQLERDGLITRKVETDYRGATDGVYNETLIRAADGKWALENRERLKGTRQALSPEAEKNYRESVAEVEGKLGRPLRHPMQELQDMLGSEYTIFEYPNKAEDKGSMSYAVTRPEQIKSAEPFTYDDGGRLIPMSRRYDGSSDDIRMSPRSGAATLVDDGAPASAIIDPSAPKDAYARSIEDIKAVIPPSQRFVGNKTPGAPVLAPDGRPYLQHDLSKPTGNLFVKQADLDQAWREAVAETGPAAQRALDEMRARGFNMVPPNEAHWRAVGNLPLIDRFWYETSAEAMVISFPGMARRGQSPKVMDTVAATSPLADPNYNAKLAISFLSEDFREVAAQTPAVVPKGVSDALLGTFGREEQRKIGSFGGTFRFLAGLSDDPPLTTNDRQVASSFGVPDKVFGEFPVMYEAVSRFYNKLRDTINNGQADKSMGAFEAHQLQALSWVQHRAELEMARNKNVSAAQAFDGDAYAVAFKRAADELRAEGIAVASDPATGLPIFDDAVLSDPRVTDVLAPTTKEFMRDTFQTMEIVTKLTKAGDEFLRNYEESKALGVKGNIKDAETVIARHMNALTTRKDLGNGKKAPSLVTELARVFDEKAEITRIEFGYGTFKKDYGSHLRIPLGSVPEQYRPAFLAILGKYYRQEAQAASRFLSAEAGQTPTSYSAFFRGRVDTDFLGAMAQELSAAGYEANVSIRPNGIVVDVVPNFGPNGPTPIDPAALKILADKAVGDTTTASVIDRDFSSIYLERTDYAREINKGKKGLLNDTAREIQKIAGVSARDSRDFAQGRTSELPGNKVINRRATKARDRYRQRLSRLESVEARLMDLAKAFQKDMTKANRAMRPKLERRRKAMAKPAQLAPAGLADL